MLTRILLAIHLLGFLILLIDLPLEFFLLHREKTPKENRLSTRLVRRFCRVAPAAYLFIIVSGFMMVAHEWSVLDAWILGSIIGYPVVIAATIRGIKPKTKSDKAARKRINIWGRSGALAFITYSMVGKPTWAGLAVAVIGFTAATMLMALASAGRTHRGWRFLGSGAVVAVVLAGVVMWRMEASKLPASFSLMPPMDDVQMAKGQMRSVEALTQAVSNAPVTNVTLTAVEKQVTVGGKKITAWAYNGQVPGPAIHVKVGGRLRVTLVNHLSEPTTIHWHGMAVPNADDGVAGVTQDAVKPGQQFVYDFIPTVAGTYWYHSHQDPSDQINKGLFGAIIVDPATPTGEQEQIAMIHTWDGNLTSNSQTGPAPVTVAAGQPLRLRLINTDSNPLHATISGAPFKALAFDSGPVNQPGEMNSASYMMAGSGRVDLGATLTAGQELDVRLGGEHPITLRYVTPGSALSKLTGEEPATLDPAHYGSAVGTKSLPAPVKTWRLNLDGAPSFYDGTFAFHFTVNDQPFPHGPMLIVHEGDTYEMTFVNRSNDDHPMHLHGHVFQVMSVNGQAATGSPLMLDNINIAPHETATVRFTADNPGIWMSHCHNLDHAAKGMDLMVAYDKVMTPFLAGSATGNHPE
jgi:FtsP/CotA-like multicopper oxidase with cupredoxin domain